MIKQKIKNGNNSLVKSSYIVGGMTFISRISGFLRDIIFANIFGASSSTDAFFVAFKIPNFFRRLFAEGAFIQSFVPVLNDYKVKNPPELKNFISYVQGNLALILLIIVIIGILFSDTIINIFAPGFTMDDPRYTLASEMLKITFPYLLFISLTAMAAGIFNTFNQFLLPSVTPVVLNLSLIVSAIFITDFFNEPIVALAYGVLIAGLLQYMIQLPSLYKLNLLVVPKIGFEFDGVNKVIKLMLPVMLGTAVIQINLIIDSIIASMLTAGSISWLYYSDRLVEFPLGIFGIAIATVILPALSRKFSSSNILEYKSMLNDSLNIAILFSLPAMIGLIVLSNLIITSLFQYGNFTINDTTMSALSLVAYSIGLPAFILMKILLTGFFSRQDTRTPVKYAIIAVIFNIIMNIGVLMYYRQSGFIGAHALLALATSLSAWIQVWLLYNNLKRDKFIINNIFFSIDTLRSVLSCLIMVTMLLYSISYITNPEKLDYYMRGMALIGFIFLGGFIYSLSMYIFGHKIKKYYT